MRNLLAFFGIILSFTAICQDSLNISKVYHYYDETVEVNDMYPRARFNETWGFVHEGEEYALIGSTFDTRIFNVTNPDSIFLMETLFGVDNAIHRDYHDFDGYLYEVSDEDRIGLRIWSMESLPDSLTLVNQVYPFELCHNIFIDTTMSTLYAFSVNANNLYKGLMVFDLSDPENPVKILENGTLLAHDGFARNDTVYINNSQLGFRISKLERDPYQLRLLGTLEVYPDQGYNHSGWLNEKGNIYALADETKGKKIKLLDVSDPENMEVLSTIGSNWSDTSMVHNLIIIDTLLYVSYYQDGFQLFDIADPSNPKRVAYYDTYDQPNYDSYYGAWGVYPFFGNQKIIVSDMVTGFYVLKVVDESVLSVYEEEKSNLIYPNPFNNVIYIPNVLSYQIYTIQGQLLLNEDSNGTERIHLGNLAEGVYWIKYNIPDNKVYTQIIIKK